MKAVTGPARVALANVETGEVQGVFELAAGVTYFPPDMMIAIVDDAEDMQPGAILPNTDAAD